MHTRKEKLEAFSELLDVIEELRKKCPWDSKQTNQSLRTNTIEEVYELADALEEEGSVCHKPLSDPARQHANSEICKELGDVLMHVCFYSLFGEEQGAFDLADVCRRLREKLIFRHPHIYGNVVATTPEQVADTWEMVKQKEKDGNKSVLSGVPKSLPSLIKAYRIQDKARHVGFDWEDRSQVWDKVKEEIREFEKEVEAVSAAEKAANNLHNDATPAKNATNPAPNGANSAKNTTKPVPNGANSDQNTTKPAPNGANSAQNTTKPAPNGANSATNVTNSAPKAASDADIEAARKRMEGEFGDVMFSLINAARLYHINPDNALERTNRKFIRRFNYLEEHTIKQGRDLRSMSLKEMDAIWDEAKRQESPTEE